MGLPVLACALGYTGEQQGVAAPLRKVLFVEERPLDLTGKAQAQEVLTSLESIVEKKVLLRQQLDGLGRAGNNGGMWVVQKWFCVHVKFIGC